MGLDELQEQGKEQGNILKPRLLVKASISWKKENQKKVSES
jgi:hypothetical protein